MDVEAKHLAPDEDGVRIAELDEMSYREKLWSHRPLTDFWRVGRGYARKLEARGIFTMGDIARCSIQNEDMLYRLFGVNAELLIDHAWGWEPCTMAEIKAYKPSTNSLGSGQVLQCPYAFAKAKLIVREMTELLVLDLVDKELVTDQIVLTIGYDVENLRDPDRRSQYRGDVTTDQYGRQIPKHAHGTANLGRHTSSTKQIMAAVTELFDRIVSPDLLVRRVNVTANHVMAESAVQQAEPMEQLDLFTDTSARAAEAADRRKERRMQETMLSIRKKFGKNAILKGMNLEEGATTMERNRQIGGHKA
jgi:DNA polymerase V